MTRALVVDSFAGGGGASAGIEAALGRSPDVAINHSASALALHAANHPETVHLDSNIWDVSPAEVTGGKPVGLLWASPDCKHFSKAKGRALRDRNIRDLAWVVIRWAREARPDVVIMENVEEFVTWGPVDDEGRVIEWLAGQTYDHWLREFRAAGYRVETRELRACDYGAPTIRKRLFVIARRDGRPIVWPDPTHGAADCPAVKDGRLKPYRTAAECIDWSLSCPSIFATSEEVRAEHGVRAVRPLAAPTLARIARGLQRYVLEAESPFVVAGGAKHAIAAAYIAQQNTGVLGRDLRQPLSTVTATGSQQTPVAAFMVKYYGTGDGARHDQPCHTVTVRDRFAHVEAALSAPPFDEAMRPRAVRVADFLRAHGAWTGDEMVTLTINDAAFVVVDIGLRMLTPRELYRAQGFPEDYVIDGAWVGDGDHRRWVAFSKSVQVSCVGNSVSPPVAEALVRANCGHLAAMADAA